MSGHNNPDNCVYDVFDSADVPTNSRYDYWLTSLLTGFEAASPTPAQRRDFQGNVVSLTTTNGALYELQSDGFSGFRSPAQIKKEETDKLALIYMLGGRAICTYENDMPHVIQPGQFLLFDARHPNHIQFEFPHFVEINLPRKLLPGVMTNGAAPRQVSEALSMSSLSRLLAVQLQQFRSLAQELDDPQRMVLLQSTESLGITILDSLNPSAWTKTNRYLDGLYAAAIRYMNQHLHRHELNATVIAQALGCSRATLYRAFKPHSRSVAEHLQDLRLEKLARLIQAESAARSIAYLAHCCGLYDTANLSRLFRKRFGCSPREFRDRTETP